MSPETIAKIRELAREGKSISAIAVQVGLSWPTVHRHALAAVSVQDFQKQIGSAPIKNASAAKPNSRPWV